MGTYSRVGDGRLEADPAAVRFLFCAAIVILLVDCARSVIRVRRPSIIVLAPTASRRHPMRGNRAVSHRRSGTGHPVRGPARRPPCGWGTADDDTSLSPSSSARACGTPGPSSLRPIGCTWRTSRCGRGRPLVGDAVLADHATGRLSARRPAAPPVERTGDRLRVAPEIRGQMFGVRRAGRWSSRPSPAVGSMAAGAHGAGGDGGGGRSRWASDGGGQDDPAVGTSGSQIPVRIRWTDTATAGGVEDLHTTGRCQEARKRQ